ncbi:MAG TPA: FtsX-like permease family protein [Solirubrobacterales bacterium]|nr:FtsX-like permease family protein [Solirubrobacterales bacterium]
MVTVAVKSLWARKLRALGTTVAVFVGVSLIAGTYVITDTINKAFDQIFSDSLKGTSVVITNKQPVTQQTNTSTSFPAGVLKKVEAVPGVNLAAGTIFTGGGIFKGDQEVGSQFSPKFISAVLPPQIETLKTVEGHRPTNDREATLDKAAADDAGLKVGDPIRIAGERRVRTYRLVGLTELGGTSFGGASIAQLTLPEAQFITGNVGRFNQISVGINPDVSSDELKARIERVVPPTLRVETAEQNANRSSNEIHDALSFLPIFLGVFAAVALIVGAFVIFNTFSITVSQRIREYGLLRTLGASRRQVLASVFVEAALIGLVGAVLGVLGGLLFAKGIESLFNALGIGLPTTALVVASRTVIVAVVIGIAVTLIAVLNPALRSTRVPPIAALQNLEMISSRRRSLVTVVIAWLLMLGGLALVLFGLFGNQKTGDAALMLGGGAALVLFGVSLYSPRLVRPLAGAIGAPLERLRGLTGRLARENSQRNPSRTAATAAALMIGLALVSFVTVFAAGLKASIADAIDNSFQGELEIQNTNGFDPIPTQIATAVRIVPGVQTVSTLQATQIKIDGVGGKPRATGLDPATADQVLKLDFQGDTTVQTLHNLSDTETIVDKSFADSNDLNVGDTIQTLGQTGERASFRIVGEVKDNADLLGSMVVTHAAMARDFAVTQDTYDFIKLAPGADPSVVQDRIDRLLSRQFPTAEVMNQQELKKNQEGQIDPLLGLVYALLSLAIIVSLFGIANTLALSIYERTRELGMLRAVGMSRRQVRTMIRYESVITALIGAVLGLVLGLIFAALMSVPLQDQGFVLSYPVGQLLLILVVAAIAGVVAAIAPARRAARLNVLDALAYE